ncbi:MAG TPA: ATP-binding cassette domain-containing protein [Reyranella sp.]|nr:ATP-binding cassette domain-containing protein [Reyranella sp.]
MVDDILVRAMLYAQLDTIDKPPSDEPDEPVDILDDYRPPGGVALTLRALTKSFGANSVLHGIDLHVPAGQFLTIIGKSGCGKSTLLRILAGLDAPTGGEVLFDGRASRQSPHVSRLMFQEPRLLPWARVLGNVEVGLGARRNAPGADRRALAKLAEVGLERRAHDWPAVLSGGQKQRVALARALASSPNFLALDEPLGALDALTRIEMQSLLESVWQEEGFTAVLVTHDVTEAVMLGDRVVLIEDGIVKLEVDVPIARPRRRGSPQVAALEERILSHLFADGARRPTPHFRAA